MKRLYTFKAKKEEEIEETTVSKDSDGKEIKTIQKKKSLVEKEFFIRKPNRILADESELFYGVKLAEGVRAGLLTRALLAKRFSNDGGVLSEDEKKSYVQTHLELINIDNEIKQISLKSGQQTEEEQKKLADLKNKLEFLIKELQEFEISQMSLFDETAENRARNKTIFWWVLHLAYEKEGPEEKPIFEGKTVEEKIGSYDKLEEEDNEFLLTITKRMVYLVTIWYLGRAQKEQEFQEADSEFLKNSASPA